MRQLAAFILLLGIAVAAAATPVGPPDWERLGYKKGYECGVPKEILISSTPAGIAYYKVQASTELVVEVPLDWFGNSPPCAGEAECKLWCDGSWSYNDGCNTTSCSPDGLCMSTLMACNRKWFQSNAVYLIDGDGNIVEIQE